MTKLLELLFSHDIEPPHTNVDQWSVEKCKMLINIGYPTIIYVVYQGEKVNYMNNRNRLSFMKVEERLHVDWAQLMFNNMCSELDRWTKCRKKCKWMGNMRIKKKPIIWHWFWKGCLDTCFKKTLGFQRRKQ